VEAIIKSQIPNEPDRAQIAVEGADHPYGEIRIDSTLENENGDDVNLNVGAQVEAALKRKQVPAAKNHTHFVWTLLVARYNQPFFNFNSASQKTGPRQETPSPLGEA
jgi:hypothetical protein